MNDAEEPTREGDATGAAAPVETHVVEAHAVEAQPADSGAEELAESAERIARIEAMPLGERAGAYGEVADELRRALENADPASP